MPLQQQAAPPPQALPQPQQLQPPPAPIQQGAQQQQAVVLAAPAPLVALAPVQAVAVPAVPLSIATADAARMAAIFADKAAFDTEFQLLGHGAVKHAYRSRNTPNIVLCIPKTSNHSASVVKEHTTFVNLRGKGLNIVNVSDNFPAPTVDDLTQAATPLGLHGSGFLEEYVAGSPLKPLQGAPSAAVDNYTRAKAMASMAVVKTAQWNGIRTNKIRLANLIADLNAILACYNNRDLSLVDLQGFLKNDGHFVIADPPTGDHSTGEPNATNKKKLANLCQILSEIRSKIP